MLTGAAAEYAGIAGTALYAAARAHIDACSKEKRRQEAVQSAIERALQDALLQTLPLLTDEPAHYARLVAPTPDTDSTWRC